MGRMAAVTTQANAGASAVAAATYLSIGPLIALAQGNGLALSVRFDQDGDEIRNLRLRRRQAWRGQQS